MNILIINCHTNNRGDEAAVRSLVDELLKKYPDSQICLAIRGNTVYPNLPVNVRTISQFVPDSLIKEILCNVAIYTRINAILPNGAKELLSEIKLADLILHAPGGPSLGDTYYESEMGYLKTFDLINKMGKPYMFYAPSMGPFKREERNDKRKKVLLNAKKIVLRDPISLKYLKELIPDIKVKQTLDSALQHDIDMIANKKKFMSYKELNDFMTENKRCIGITVTDLMWHPIYQKDKKLQNNIRNTFSVIIEKLIQDGYGIVFIPQLYGIANDSQLMKSYCKSDKCFVVADNNEDYDSYFQQYIISKMYAVIGMRYHSNIFSAKMETPFISVSYEQKMSGFMRKMELQDYLIDINDLSEKKLWEKYMYLRENYDDYKRKLVNLHKKMKEESFKTTEEVIALIKELHIK